MPQRIALVPMSAKPYTAGHDGLVRIASRECDEVHLFVSTSDRYRPGEAAVTGVDMKKLWDRYIEASLPKNVTVTYGGSPVANVFKALDTAGKSGSENTYVVYSDPQDAATNFPEQVLQKYGRELFDKGQVQVRPVKRTETVDVSGTKLRQALASGDKASFMKGLPPVLQRDDVWNMLHATAKNPPPDTKKTSARKKAPPTVESVVRELIRLLISG